MTANLLTGLGIDEYFRRTDSSGAMSFLADALGSTVALTDSTGALNTQYTYEPYGKTTASGPTNASSYQYTGRENDGTGLYFYRARYYSPTFQRFISQDPIGFRGGPNPYEYVVDDPLDLRDPGGNQLVSAIATAAAVGAATGAVAGAVGGFITGALNSSPCASGGQILGNALTGAAGGAFIGAATGASVGALSGGAAVLGASAAVVAGVTGGADLGLGVAAWSLASGAAGAFGGAVGAIADIGLEGVSPAIALPTVGAASGLAEAGFDQFNGGSSSCGCH